eukprot:TRINITY_DN54879_c0_g1_i1.p1 TRINITY_DN54879_c0_g1~~TRINITY_DN54879_c0_g1_i1.p1  ORF type:complete len:828 (+),score=179.60 TRINITY_DN54879_c0_g1_i1:78-2561(+)
MADGATAGNASSLQERRERRRVSALLNTFYAIDAGSATDTNACDVSGGGGDGANDAKSASVAASDPQLDRQGFDAKRYFDGVVASRELTSIVERKSALDSEVKQLDADMQTLVYENYSKFIRATDVIKEMKVAIEGLKPDMNKLRGNMNRLTDCEARCEKGVSDRAGQLAILMKQQSVCKKLQMLFELPSTLRSCLERGEYGRAISAHQCCAEFLRRYQHMPTFQKVLKDVEEHMEQIRTALEVRIASNELSADEAVESSLMLMNLGLDHRRVVSEYLNGRRAVLQHSLHRCFSEPEPPPGGSSGLVAAAVGVESGATDPMGNVTLSAACARATEWHVPALCDAVEGLQRLRQRQAGVGNCSEAEEELSSFVRPQVEELLDRIAALLEGGKCPSTQVLVSSVNAVRDVLRRLHTLLPQILKQLFMAFLDRVTTGAMNVLFADASSALVGELRRLHGECRRLELSSIGEAVGEDGQDDVLEEIAKMEQAVIMHILTALSETQPLLALLGSDRGAGQQLVRSLHEQLIRFFLVFVEACHLFVGNEATEAQNLDPSLPVLPRHRSTLLEEVILKLEWSNLFSLALVRIGRHMEVKAINQVWGVAKDLFASSAAAVDLAPNVAVIKAARGAAKAVLTNYALAGGQQLARLMQDSLHGPNWLHLREPREPRVVVETVLRRVHGLDAQLALVLGDPRKPQSADSRRRVLNQRKTSMELEIEREWAKKVQVFATVPFNRNGVVLAILRIAFKALYEHVREETFGKFGLQQIQVDCAFLAEVVRDFVEAEDAGVLDSLLDEAVSSASQRCVDSVLMDVEVLEALCDEKKRSFKLD